MFRVHNNKHLKKIIAILMVNMLSVSLFAFDSYADEPSLPEATSDFEVPSIEDELEAVGVSDENMDEKALEIVEADDTLELLNSSLESKYDPRSLGYLSDAKDQTGYGNACWAFAQIAAAEACLAKNQVVMSDGTVADDELDLSEAGLMYSFYHMTDDTLKNLTGDLNENISSVNYMNVGGNCIFSTFSLASWISPAYENTAPLYSLDEGDDELLQGAAYNSAAHLENSYWINFCDANASQIIKQMIKSYGGVVINMYYSNTASMDCYNDDTYAYYRPYGLKNGSNHSVLLVGWDDDYSKSNFNSTGSGIEQSQPTGDGAWIAKNSYGDGWGDDGYFYISYEDNDVSVYNTSSNYARAYVYDYNASNNYDLNYQYDGTGSAYNCMKTDDTTFTVKSGGSIANVFWVPEDSDSDQSLEAVSMALFDTAVNYSVQIYKNPADESDPTSGTAMLTTPEEGNTSYAGYYTIKLDEPVSLSHGDKFAVVITLSKESGTEINYFADTSCQNGSWIKFTNVTSAGQSFANTDGTWVDLNDINASARIKAFTSYVSDEENTEEDSEDDSENTEEDSEEESESRDDENDGENDTENNEGSNDSQNIYGQIDYNQSSEEAIPAVAAKTYDGSGIEIWFIGFAAGLLILITAIKKKN